MLFLLCWTECLLCQVEMVTYMRSWVQIRIGYITSRATMSHSFTIYWCTKKKNFPRYPIEPASIFFFLIDVWIISFHEMWEMGSWMESQWCYIITSPRRPCDARAPVCLVSSVQCGVLNGSFSALWCSVHRWSLLCHSYCVRNPPSPVLCTCPPLFNTTGPKTDCRPSVLMQEALLSGQLARQPLKFILSFILSFIFYLKKKRFACVFACMCET